MGLLLTGLIVGGLMWIIGTIGENRQNSRIWRERKARYYEEQRRLEAQRLERERRGW